MSAWEKFSKEEKDAIIETQIRDKFRTREWIAPKYYDYPDGEDILGKLSYTMKNAAFFSCCFGVLYSSRVPPSDALGKVIRVAKLTVPSIAAAFTFTCVTYFSTVIRKKDDELNYVLGGAAAGALLGPAVGCLSWSPIGMMICSTAGYAKKYYQMRGLNMFQPLTKRNFSSYYGRHDFTLTPSIKGNWTK